LDIVLREKTYTQQIDYLHVPFKIRAQCHHVGHFHADRELRFQNSNLADDRKVAQCSQHPPLPDKILVLTLKDLSSTIEIVHVEDFVMDHSNLTPQHAIQST
jgi:hypothetical protein